MAKGTRRGRKAQPQARRKALAPRPARGAPAGIEARRIDLVMRAVNEGVYDWDIAGGTIYYSEGVHRATGMSPRHIRTPEDWRNRIHPEDLPGYDAALIAHFRGETERFECDYRFRDRKGGWRWARQHGIAERDADGRAVRLVGSTGDITGLKQAEHSLREAQERLALATQAATEGIYEWNLATGSLFLSDRAKAYFAVKGRKLTPAAWNALLHKEDFAGYQAAIAAFFKSRRTQFEHEYRIRKAGGGLYWILDRAVAVRDAKGRVTRLVGAIADITPRKEAEIELRRARDEATEALERQTATAEILKVIASSPSDVQPVFDAIAASAQRLISGYSAAVILSDGDTLRLQALTTTSAAGDAALRSFFPAPLSTGSGSVARAIRAGEPQFVGDTQNDPGLAPVYKKMARARGYRSSLAVPMLRDRKAIGVINVTRREPGAFPDHQIRLLRVFADQAVMAIENVRLFNETKEALERQTATAEVLRVISGSPTDTQPVFETIVRSCQRLFGGRAVAFCMPRGDMIETVAFADDGTRGSQTGGFLQPFALDRGSAAGACILDRRVVHVPDTREAAAEFPRMKQLALALGYLSGLFVPLVQADRTLGMIGILRAQEGSFTEREVALAGTFADQAVIAIENVRLFNETREALEQQTATAEILKVISGSPENVQPVLDAVAKRAAQICEASDARIFLDVGGRALHAAGFGDVPMPFALGETMELDRSTVSGRAIIDAATVHVTDMAAASREEFPTGRMLHERSGYRTILAVPMLREGRALGAIMLRRMEVRPFTDKQVALLGTFADQAAIAIENVRLFNETREALEQQKASADVLGAISGSITDTKPVFDRILDSCERLFAGNEVGITLATADGRIELAAYHGRDYDKLKSVYPLPLSRESGSGVAILDAAVAHYADVEAAGVPPGVTAGCRAIGMRAILFAPMLHEGRGVGAVWVGRLNAGAFTEKQIGLLRTFADQAVIAIQNARLFNETREALERQTATAEILKIIASSPSDVQPVFEAIAASARRLLDGGAALVARRDGDWLHLAAYTSTNEAADAALEKLWPSPITGKGHMGRAVVSAHPVLVEDIQNDNSYSEAFRESARTRGVRSVVSVPMLREGEAIGVISVNRPVAGRFSDHQTNLLRTFADQAVIAIENVRLFNETREALERQTATAEVLKVIASSPSDVQPVFDIIAERAVALSGAHDGVVTRFDGQLVHFAAMHKVHPEGAEAIRSAFPCTLDRNSAGPQAIRTSQVVHLPDVREIPDYYLAKAVDAGGVFRMLAVPLLREGKAMGAITLAHKEPGYFSDHVVELLKTFADQAVIAIENVRLFNETREALERQTATAEILNVIASSPSDVQPVFDAIAKSAYRLIGGFSTAVARVFDDVLHLVAFSSTDEAGNEALKHAFPMPVSRSKAARTGAPVCISDTEALPESASAMRELARTRGFRSIVIVPMLREGAAIGTISVTRRDPGDFSDHQVDLLKTFADQAVIAIENVRLFNETKEALERQTATSSVLREISRSTFDLDAILQTLLDNAMRLCGAVNCAMFLKGADGRFRFASQVGYVPDSPLEKALRNNPIRPGPDTTTGRALLERRTVHTHDIRAERGYRPDLVALAEYRTNLAVPMLRDGEVMGAITLTRGKDVSPFTDKQIELVEGFSAQAVIAIENVRLFNETKEALERQTATAEILKVIASSPSDVQPVFEAIVASGIKLFSGAGLGIGIVNGEEVVIEAAAGMGGVGKGFRMPLSRDSASGMAILERKLVNIADTEAPGVPPHARENGRRLGIRSMTQAPMFREGEPIGSIGVMRKEAGGLDDKQLALLRTFADQAVIAIENVRLFKELQSQTEALTRSVGQLTALGEVGQAISSTLDLETVLQTIVSRAVQLTGMDAGSIYEYDEQAEVYRLTAAEKMAPELVEAVRQAPIRKGDGATGRTAVTLEPVQAADIQDASYQGSRKDNLMRTGYRAVLAVPLLREDHLLGALQVFRCTPGEFAPEIVELLKTFATQSAMAIQNARLFREIADKGRQLEEASRHKSDFLASMSHELRTPLNAILGFNEMILGQVYGDVPADMKEPLEDIQKSGKHLLRLINNVLDLAKIEAGRMELSVQDYSVQDTVESVRATLRPLAAEKGLEFRASVPGDLPLARGDSGRIAQCLMNLAGNSLKFTKAGKVEIAVALQGDRLRFSVADTGIGIPADKIGGLFTEFKQTDASIASEYGGTGLGLSITKKFIEMHGGRIWVESEPGRGSTFLFEVPLRVSA